MLTISSLRHGIDHRGCGGVHAAKRVGQQHENVSLLPSIDNPSLRKAAVGAIGEVVRLVRVEREGVNGISLAVNREKVGDASVLEELVDPGLVGVIGGQFEAQPEQACTLRCFPIDLTPAQSAPSLGARGTRRRPTLVNRSVYILHFFF